MHSLKQYHYLVLKNIYNATFMWIHDNCLIASSIASSRDPWRPEKPDQRQRAGRRGFGGN